MAIYMLAVGVLPNVVSYAGAIKACGDCGQWEKAIDLHREMAVDRVRPDAFSYAAVIKACADGGQWQKAHELHREMATKEIAFNVLSYNTTTEARRIGNDDPKEVVEDLLRKMEAKGLMSPIGDHLIIDLPNYKEEGKKKRFLPWF